MLVVKNKKLKCVEIEIWMTKRGGMMIGLIIATHGNSSVELIKGAEMFAGPLSQCRAWTLNPGDDIQKGEQMLEEYVDELDQESWQICLEEHLPTWQQKLP